MLKTELYSKDIIYRFDGFIFDYFLLLGFQKALDHLDEVIRIIRAAKIPREAREGLIAAFQFSERQAQAIIELQLQRLTGMEQQKIIEELQEIQVQIAGYLEILGSEKVLNAVIIRELREVQKDFGDDRRTQIVEDEGEIALEDLIQMEDVAVTISRGGYLKRTPVDTYRRQTRGGKGRIGMSARGEDVIDKLIISSTHSYLLIFTNKGRVYWLKVYNIPDLAAAGKGKNINGLINLQADEVPKAFLPVKEFTEDKFIAMITKQGVIKRCQLTEFDNVMQRGIIACALDDGDELIAARITSGGEQIFLATREGMAIRFKEEDVRAMGRPARGVRAMSLDKNDHLVGAAIVNDDSLILSISERGFGKRTPAKDYRMQTRGGKGVINMKTTTKVGKVVEILEVQEDTDLMIISQEGQIIRIESGQIRQAGRSTQGVTLVKMEGEDRVSAASVVPYSPEVLDGSEEEPGEPGPVV